MTQPPPPGAPPPGSYPPGSHLPPPTPPPRAPRRRKTPVWVWLLVAFFGFSTCTGVVAAISGGTGDVTFEGSPSPGFSASPTPTPTPTPTIVAQRKVTGYAVGIKRDGADIRTTLTMNNVGLQAGVGVCTVTAYDASGKALASDTFTSTGRKMAPGSTRVGTAVVQMVDEADAALVDTVRAENCHLE